MPILQFKGKAAIETYHHTVPHHTLDFDRKLSVLDKNEKPSLDGNLIIEGDNLLALKALLPTHAGQVKCIYIDPPYNTGNEKWVYNDNLTQPQFKEWIGQTVGKEAEDACRHDKWCCMMYPRLQLLKEFLTEDGAIFISINDVELADLRLMMDEIFGESNFVATIIWQNIFTIKNSARYLSTMHDYVVLYAKNKGIWRPILTERTEEQEEEYSNPDDDPKGDWISHALQSRNYYSKGTYKVECPGGRMIEGPPSGTYWRTEETKFWDLDKKGQVWWGKDKNNAPRIKEYLEDAKDGIVPTTLWLHKDAGTNSGAKTTIREIFSGHEDVFVTPKPLELIKKIIKLSTRRSDIILDSFSGSGTTAHAVVSLNNEDGGNRRFILVQKPYDTKDNEADKFNICEKITAERVRRVIKGYPFEGLKTEILLEEKISISTLKKADTLLSRMEQVKKKAAKNFDDVKNECKEGVVRVLGIKKVEDKAVGLGGSFTYARLSSKPLYGEYRAMGDELPAYEEIAKYIFYTETSRQFDKKAMNPDTGLIGINGTTSYYLLYRPNGIVDWPIDMEFLRTTAINDTSKVLVVYCEKIWLHRSDLNEWQSVNGKTVRPMLVPFNLK